MSDFQSVIREIVAFRDAREWRPFHTPRNLAAAVAIEAAELQEVMLWKSEHEVDELLKGESHERVADELADVLIFALLLAHEIGVDPADEIRRKLEKNQQKYPVDRAKGRADKYTDLDG